MSVETIVKCDLCGSEIETCPDLRDEWKNTQYMFGTQHRPDGVCGATPKGVSSADTEICRDCGMYIDSKIRETMQEMVDKRKT